MKTAHFFYHPMLVHFPIAFYFLEFFLLGLWIWKKEDSFRRFAFLDFRIGYVLMLAAMAAGYRDAGGINPMVQKHFYSALSVFAVSTLRGILWFRMNRKQEFSKAVLFLGSLVLVILVAVTGDLGGDLVYRS